MSTSIAGTFEDRLASTRRIGTVVAIAAGVSLALGVVVLAVADPFSLPVLPGIALFTIGVLNLPLALFYNWRIGIEVTRRRADRAASLAYDAASDEPDLRATPSVALARRLAAERTTA